MISRLKMDWSYATRSLIRNKHRTLLSIIAVFISVFVSIVTNRYASAVLTLWEDATCSHGVGHAQIHKKGFQDNPDSLEESQTFIFNDPVEDALRKDSDVLGVARRMRMEGIVSTGDRSIYFTGIGVDPINELTVSPQIFDPSSDAGSFVTETDTRGVVIGKGMAESLGVKVGDELTLIAQTVQGSQNAIDVRIRGIVNFPIPSISKRIMYVPITSMQKLVRLGDRFTELVVRLRSPQLLDSWTQRMREPLATQDAVLQTWWELEPIVRDVEKIWYSVVGVVSVLLFVAAILSVLNIVFVTVAERTVEIGTLMALGAKPSRVRSLFSTEALVVGLIGSVTGIVLSWGVVLLMGILGVPFESPYGLGTIRVFPTVNVWVAVEVGCLAVVVCVLAAIPASRKAAQVDPVAAFRGQMT